MQFHRFEHVNQICQDLEGTRQFYLSLNQPPELDKVQKSTGHIDHIGFVIDDSEAMKALFDAKGIQYYTYKSPETKCRIYVSDPDGTELELVEYEEDYALK